MERPEIDIASSTSPDTDSQKNIRRYLSGNTADHNRHTSSDSTRSGVTKPKQKRNKPTLSCLECVERKTKCDRGRPCSACIRRQSGCNYTAVADFIAAADSNQSIQRARGPSDSRARHITKILSTIRHHNATPNASIHDSSSPSSEQQSQQPPNTTAHRLATGSTHSHTNDQLAINGITASSHSILQSQTAPSNLFGDGTRHPFANYWTWKGGLPEVLTVMPTKEQADILVMKYFDTVDAVSPFIHRRCFYADYERFWAMSADDKAKTDASLIALHYSIYALGTLFMPFPSRAERAQTAEFYCSASNQALRIFAYLNRTSMYAIQAGLLVTYFLMNNNHTSDAYAWAGIHLRQAYAMRLHRDPEAVVPHASALEKQTRRKLWQAIFFQDTFFTVLHQLPPTATHSDVPIDSLADENELSDAQLDTLLTPYPSFPTPSSASPPGENYMSIDVIAPPPRAPLTTPTHHSLPLSTLHHDNAYMRCVWHLGTLVQETISSPLSLSFPLISSSRQKDSLLQEFRRLYRSFPTSVTDVNPSTLAQRAATAPRFLRQTLFLTTNYFHALMLLAAAANPDPKANVPPDFNAVLDAAHLAIAAFLALAQYFPADAAVWWVFQHRALAECEEIVRILAMCVRVASGEKSSPTKVPISSQHSRQTSPLHTPAPFSPLTAAAIVAVDPPRMARARDDVRQMLEVVSRLGENAPMLLARRDSLASAFEKLGVQME